MEKLKIRTYKHSDHGDVVELHRSALKAAGAYGKGGDWEKDLNDIEANYLGPRETFLVGVIGGNIVAMGALRQISETKGEIKRIRVSPKFWRKGFGQAMLDAVEKEARRFGYKSLRLDTTILQEPAQKLFLKFGYRELRRVKRGYPLEMIFYEKGL